jgi:hypothetical protein
MAMPPSGSFSSLKKNFSLIKEAGSKREGNDLYGSMDSVPSQPSS